MVFVIVGEEGMTADGQRTGTLGGECVTSCANSTGNRRERRGGRILFLLLRSFSNLYSFDPDSFSPSICTYPDTFTFIILKTRCAFLCNLSIPINIINEK